MSTKKRKRERADPPQHRADYVSPENYVASYKAKWAQLCGLDLPSSLMYIVSQYSLDDVALIFCRYLLQRSNYIESLERLNHLDFKVERCPLYYLFSGPRNMDSLLAHRWDYFENRVDKTEERQVALVTAYRTAIENENDMNAYMQCVLHRLSLDQEHRFQLFCRLFPDSLREPSRVVVQTHLEEIEQIASEVRAGDDDYCGRCDDKYRPYECETMERMCPVCANDLLRIYDKIHPILSAAMSHPTFTSLTIL